MVPARFGSQNYSRRLFSKEIPLFVFCVLPFQGQTFVLGGFSFFGILYSQEHLKMSNPSYWFGGVTVVAGLLGTYVGGWAIDKLLSRHATPQNQLIDHSDMGTSISDMELNPEESEEQNRRRLRTGLGFVTVCSVAVLPFAFLAFWFDQPPNPPLFFGLLAVAEFLVFCCLSPINSCTMW